MNTAQTAVLGSVEAIVENHLRLDGALDASLNLVVGDTELSALAIIQQVRQLYDSAAKLVTYLDGTSLKAGNLGQEIQNSAAFLSHIGTFIQALPAKMEADLRSVQMIAKEIRELGGLVEDVQAISMQSHLLAINAAIEASRAGTAGAAFRVVAEEMRKLATNSSTMAGRIKLGLSRARQVVEVGMASSITESAQQLTEVSQAAVNIQKLRDNLDDMSQYYKTRIAIVTKHNEDLARDIAEVLGQIQYQDVVRQSIERIRFAMGQRNALLQNCAGMTDDEPVALADVPEQLELILHDYLAEQGKHQHSARETPAAGEGPKLELF